MVCYGESDGRTASGALRSASSFAANGWVLEEDFFPTTPLVVQKRVFHAPAVVCLYEHHVVIPDARSGAGIGKPGTHTDAAQFPLMVRLVARLVRNAAYNDALRPSERTTDGTGAPQGRFGGLGEGKLISR